MKKFLSVLLAVLLTVTCLPLTALAAEPDSEEDGFTVVATSNFFPETRTLYPNISDYEDANGDMFVTVYFKMQALGKYLINLDVDELTWDPSVLEFKEAYNKFGSGRSAVFSIFPFAVEQGCGAGMVNSYGDNNGGRIVGNYDSRSPAAYATEEDGSAITVVRATFKVLDRDAKITTVNLKMDTLSLCDETIEEPYPQDMPIEKCVINPEVYGFGTYETVIEPTGEDVPVYGCLHTYTYTVPGKAPTCTETGLTEGKRCLYCGEITVPQEELPALGHHPIIDHETEATCQQEGHTLGVYCDRCGEVYVPMEIIPKVPHTVVKDEAVAPTCDTAGKTEGSHCSMCGEIIVEQQVIPALGHHYVYVPAKEATYMHTGHTEGVQCDRCEKWLVATEETPLKPVDFMIGDVTGDELLTVEDITAVQRMLSEFLTADLTDEKTFLQYDFNGDEKINIKDVTAMQRKLAELE